MLLLGVCTTLQRGRPAFFRGVEARGARTKLHAVGADEQGVVAHHLHMAAAARRRPRIGSTNHEATI